MTEWQKERIRRAQLDVYDWVLHLQEDGLTDQQIADCLQFAAVMRAGLEEVELMRAMPESEDFDLCEFLTAAE